MASSVEKVAAQLDHFEGLSTEDPRANILIGGIALMRPQVQPYIPTDPDQLDELLLAGARWALGMRSDDALAQVIVGVDEGNGDASE